MAIISSFYAIYHGPSGLTQIAKRLVELRINLESSLVDLGFDIPEGIRFDSVDVYSEHSQKIHNEALKNGYNLRILPLGSTIEDSTGFGISLDELSNEKEIKDILNFIANVIEKEEDLEHIKFDKEFHLESLTLRSSAWMQQDIFINYQSETCLLYTSPSPRDATLSRMPSSA